MTDFAEIARIVLFVAGVALIAYGMWLVYVPFGFISAGTMLFGAAVYGAMRSGVRK